ncbi:hypothetical protein EAI_00801, partial [Harpegnathos saltator]
CGFFLFPKFKLPLRGRGLRSIKNVKENSQRELKATPLTSASEKCFEDWVTDVGTCVL